MKIDAIVFARPNTVELGRFELPAMRDHHLLVRTLYTFVSSGTETRVLAGHYGADKVFPLIPGYACVGRVLEVGKGVKGYAVGDLLSYSPPYNDDSSQPLGIGTQWGGQASHHLLPTWFNPIILPVEADPLTYVPAQVAAIPLRGVTMAQPRAGETAVVIGQGVIGALSSAWLAAHGCKVIVADVGPSRLERAGRHWACATVEASDQDAAVHRIKALTNGGADIVVEASGVPAGAALAHQVVRKVPTQFAAALSIAAPRWPRLVYQANYLTDITIQPDRYFDGEGVIVLTSMDRGAEDRQRAVHAITTGQLNTKPFLEHIVPFREAPGHYDRLARRDGLFSLAFDWAR